MQANPVQTSAVNVTSARNEVEVMNKKYTILYKRLSRDDPENRQNWLVDESAAAEKTGVTKNTLDRAKAALGVKSVKRGDNWLWELPHGGEQLQDTQEPQA
jgi:hypothetical protein